MTRIRTRGSATGALVLVPLVIAGLTVASPAAGAPTVKANRTGEFTVLATSASTVAAAVQTVRRAGGVVDKVNRDIGLITATASSADFARRIAASADVYGVAPNRSIGRAPKDVPAQAADLAVETDLPRTTTASAKPAAAVAGLDRQVRPRAKDPTRGQASKGRRHRHRHRWLAP
jgi:lantibiotic leader peptide-processing serine protease